MELTRRGLLRGAGGFAAVVVSAQLPAGAAEASETGSVAADGNRLLYLPSKGDPIPLSEAGETLVAQVQADQGMAYRMIERVDDYPRAVVWVQVGKEQTWFPVAVTDMAVGNHLVGGRRSSNTVRLLNGSIQPIVEQSYAANPLEVSVVGLCTASAWHKQGQRPDWAPDTYSRGRSHW